jgi:FixJ family two-component response regulator
VVREPVVAIVDDDPDLRDALEMMLALEGFRTEPFASAKEFIAAARTTQATCLLVDLQLGDMSGIEMCHVLSAMGYNFPIVFMSGAHDHILYRLALDVPHVAFLHKPFPIEQLVECVGRTKIHKAPN